MNVKWLLEEDFFWENNPDVLSPALDKLGIEYKKSEPVFCGQGEPEKYFDKDDCVIAYGSLDFIKAVKRRTPYYPGVFCNLDNMRCSAYYTHYYDYLFNRPATFVPLGLFKRDPMAYSSITGDDYIPMFIRPDDGDKKFTGFVAHYEDAMEKMSRMSYGNLDDRWFIVISSDCSVCMEAEYRFFVTKGEVITGSTYKRRPYPKGELRHEEIPEYPQEAYNLAKTIADLEWQPDPVYSVDIVKTIGGEYSLLEINSFSSAGLYACDIEKLVLRASEIAKNEWSLAYCNGAN